MIEKEKAKNENATNCSADLVRPTIDDESTDSRSHARLAS